MFSPRNVLEIAVALRLRAAMLPVSAVGAVIRVLVAFEARMKRMSPAFTLPDSLREPGAPDLRLIVSDGTTIYFSLGPQKGGEPKLFGGIPLEQIAGNRPGSFESSAARPVQVTSNGEGRDTFGGPEHSQFVRLELSLTEVARALPLG